MLWIKRNIFLVGFGLVALALLAGGLLYLWSSSARNQEIEGQVSESKTQLETLLKQTPFPSATNIATAKAQLDQARRVITNIQQLLQAVPVEKITNQQPFKAALNRTIAELQQKAEGAGIDLPKKDYAFTFEAQQRQLNLNPASFGTLCEQLAEIKAICLVLFDAKINRLANIKRWRVTPDDTMVIDYFDTVEGPTTNKLISTVASPYEVKFDCFSSELAAALEGFYKTPFAINVKTVAVEPAAVTADRSSPAAPAPGAPPPRLPPPRVQNPGMMPPPGQRPPPPGGGYTPRPPPQGARPGLPPPPGPKELLQVVLNERLLNVTLRLEVIKPLMLEGAKPLR